MATNRATYKNRMERNIVARQRRVAELLSQGQTQKEIAGLLDVSEATVSLDNAANLARLRTAGVLDTQALVIRQLTALQGDEPVLREDWLATGNPIQYQALLSNMKRQAELMALDAPARKDTGSQVADLDALLRELDRL